MAPRRKTWPGLPGRELNRDRLRVASRRIDVERLHKLKPYRTRVRSFGVTGVRFSPVRKDARLRKADLLAIPLYHVTIIVKNAFRFEQGPEHHLQRA